MFSQLKGLRDAGISKVERKLLTGTVTDLVSIGEKCLDATARRAPEARNPRLTRRCAKAARWTTDIDFRRTRIWVARNLRRWTSTESGALRNCSRSVWRSAGRTVRGGNHRADRSDSPDGEACRRISDRRHCFSSPLRSAITH